MSRPQLPAAIGRATIAAGDVRQVVPALIAAAGLRAGFRFLAFLVAPTRNLNTRRAYGCAMADFLARCEDNTVPALAAVQPLHVATWIES